MSNNEYEQQQFWEDKPNITPGILGNTFKLTLKKDWFKSSIFDELLYGESYTHVTKDDIRRIHPLSEEANDIYQKHILSNKGIKLNDPDPNKHFSDWK